MAPWRRRSKFGAVKTEVDGRRFDSKAEARRYQELLLLGKAGELRELELQPSFRLTVNGTLIAHYVGDFAYLDYSGRYVVEDVKGMKTPVYQLKKKLMKALHAIEVQEIV